MCVMQDLVVFHVILCNNVFFICPQCTYQLVVAWIIDLAVRETAKLNQQSVSDVARLQAMGLVAIAISEAVLPKGADSKLSVDELEDVATLLSYCGLPLNHVLECQEVVCKIFLTMKSR